MIHGKCIVRVLIRDPFELLGGAVILHVVEVVESGVAGRIGRGVRSVRCETDLRHRASHDAEGCNQSQEVDRGSHRSRASMRHHGQVLSQFSSWKESLFAKELTSLRTKTVILVPAAIPES